MRLYIEGHNVRRGYAISLTWTDAEIPTLPEIPAAELLEPVRFYTSLRRALRLVDRFNRRFGA